MITKIYQRKLFMFMKIKKLINKVKIGYSNLGRFNENKNLNMYYRIILKFLKNEKLIGVLLV